MKRIRLSLALLLFASGAIAADSLPLLEIGAGLVALSAPDYRGADTTSDYLLPAPYLKYRGKRLRVDEGAEGLLIEKPDLILSLSGNLSLPVDDDIPEREGMTELDAILEIGPSLNYRFYELRKSDWWLDLPLRLAYTLDGDFDAIGYIFQPRLSWRRPATRLGETKLRFNIGPLYSSQEHHDYFYSVDPAEATPTRPVYSADGGFSGFRTEFTYSRRLGNYWLGGFLRYDSLRGSEIEDSPLVRKPDAWMGGIGLAWVFHQK